MSSRHVPATCSWIAVAGLVFAGCNAEPSGAAAPVAAQAPAAAGLFTQFAAPVTPGSPSPVVFETWASDAADGTPYALGNSVIEGLVGNGTVAASSCIACHAYASFGPTGAPTKTATAILPFNPTGKPIQTVLNESRTFSFNWGVLLAPK